MAFPSADAPWYKKLFAFAGLGFLISVGYMDPGNWATDLAAGSAFGYSLLFVVLLSSVCAMFLQYLSLKLGIATDRDLAQACRDAYHPAVNRVLWAVAELAIGATDLAEVVGCAIAFNLLLGMPLWAGVLVTAADVLLLMAAEARGGFRSLEVLVGLLTAIIAGCFVYELARSQPDFRAVAAGYLPDIRMVTDSQQLYLATGILGATVMPHNLYLHSSVIQTRAYPRTPAGRSLAVRLGGLDSSLSLLLAFFINSAILILAAAAFHEHGRTDVADIGDAYELLATSLGAKAASILFGVALLAAGQNSTITGTLSGQIVMEGFLAIKCRPWLRRLITRGTGDAYELLATSLGAKAASILFGVALLAAGQNSTITGTLSGQIVMEGFLAIKCRPWLRRLITRGTAIIPAAVVAAVMGREGVGQLLVLSQVILSLTLPFAVFPLVHFTGSRKYLGKYANGWMVSATAWTLFVLISALNINLVVQSVRDGSFGGFSTRRLF
ncbi:hypothetical protein CHLRE_07g321951v5 [Chlamydomonas reinhardtii]|uniref:Divalent metal cation transporter MntH n=1 Tax=Chlamydomonas reinhardtii TaxID=3055 RepID=A0A2K3DJ35_CHLRE|nr:uncharacterized protein CHLRE_07g321951v5 [Chlamydomonas reinhardtii]PNW80544.1 hypothetical protein CHLRE_07g321951v5 [Chlamydomonas reinhardtii]